MRLFLFSIFFLVLTIFDSSSARAERPVVVTSLAVQRNIVKSIAGDLATVESLVPDAEEADHYHPSMKQMRLINDAIIFVIVGHQSLTFEKKLSQIVNETKHAQIVNPAKNIKLIDDDPHVWLSQQYIYNLIADVSEALTGKFPQDQAAIKERAGKLKAEIDKSIQLATKLLKRCKGKNFLVFHPAWGYFARDYSMIQHSVESGGHEPGIGAISHVIKEAKEFNARYIFSRNDKNHKRDVKVIAREIGAEHKVIDPLSPDWAENIISVARVLNETVCDDE